MNYILQKDSLTIAKGTKAIAVYTPKGVETHYWIDCKDGNKLRLSKDEVENNPKWFKPEEERIRIDYMDKDIAEASELNAGYYLTKKSKKEWSVLDIDIISKALNGELFTKDEIVDFLSWKQSGGSKLGIGCVLLMDILNEYLKQRKS